MIINLTCSKSWFTDCCAMVRCFAALNHTLLYISLHLKTIDMALSSNCHLGETKTLGSPQSLLCSLFSYGTAQFIQEHTVFLLLLLQFSKSLGKLICELNTSDTLAREGSKEQGLLLFSTVRSSVLSFVLVIPSSGVRSRLVGRSERGRRTHLLRMPCVLIIHGCVLTWD